MTNQKNSELAQQQPVQKRQQKPKGRGHGEGSVFERKTGDRNKSWVAQVPLGSGKKKIVGYYATKQEAITAKNKALQELEQGRLALGPKQTVKHYLEQWLEDVHKQDISLNTYIHAQVMVRKHIVPAIGHLMLKNLTAQHIQAFYARKLKEDLSPGYIALMHRLLNKALKNAVRWRLVSFNIMEGVTSPKPQTHEMPILNREQAQMLFQKAQEMGLGAFVTLAMTTGMRHGELLALRWQDIDFEMGWLQVIHNVTRQGGYGYITGEPKTNSGKRKIMLPEFVLDELRNHLIVQGDQQQRAGSEWEDHDLVFPNKQGRFANAGGSLNRFRKVLKMVGLPTTMRVHDLRHNAATLLLSMGVNIKEVQELLGHSDPSITLSIYGHVIPNTQKATMEKWTPFLQGDDSDKV